MKVCRLRERCGYCYEKEENTKQRKLYVGKLYVGWKLYGGGCIYTADDFGDFICVDVSVVLSSGSGGDAWNVGRNGGGVPDGTGVRRRRQSGSLQTDDTVLFVDCKDYIPSTKK
jgi:hypothetical protein